MASQDWFDKDFYKVLGVSKDISDAELKKIYRKLARQYHPDSNPGNAAAEAKFKEISEAHSVLSDPAQRKEYDAVRAMGSGARFTAPGGGGTRGGGGFEDVFSGMFGGRAPGGSSYDDIFADIMDRSSQRGYGPRRGRDISASTTLEFLTATRGGQITLQTSDGKPITVNIPPGVSDGQKIRLPKKGNPSSDGGESGDLVISIKVKKHPIFERDGLNLRVNVPVTFVEATLGATIEVPTLGGETVKLRVAPGTPSGRVLRLKGRGVASKKATGDLLAIVTVVVPAHISKESTKILEKFRDSLPEEDPREDLLAKAKG